jgi:hypothetical protein
VDDDPEKISDQVLLHQQLPPGRAQELKEQLLLAGVPL